MCYHLSSYTGVLSELLALPHIKDLGGFDVIIEMAGDRNLDLDVKLCRKGGRIGIVGSKVCH